jgi:ADP-ribose pyrophosphatase YjhB (NUDIX family)
MILERLQMVDPNQQHHLKIANAIAAILKVEDGRFLLQLRDDIPQIWYPNHWGLFGGSVEPGEDEIEALRREQLELEFTEARLFTRFEFDLQPIGLERYFRSYYEVPISATALARLVLQEGADMRSVPGDEALRMKLVPYDGFALFLHHQQKRLVADGSRP